MRRCRLQGIALLLASLSVCAAAAVNARTALAADAEVRLRNRLYPLHIRDILFHYSGLDSGLDRLILMQKEKLKYGDIDFSRVRLLKFRYFAGEKRFHPVPDFFSRFDIGVMPLRDFEFAKGKCAFKIIQYMAAGLPVVASPVGANREVIRDGVNGFLAEGEEEWAERLGRLISDPVLRMRMGEAGRETVKRRYSLEGELERYARLFTGENS